MGSAHEQNKASTEKRLLLAGAFFLMANAWVSVSSANQIGVTGSTTTIVTDPVGERWDYTYQKNLGVYRLTSRFSRTDGKGETRHYDANNNLVWKTGEEGRTTTYSYNTNNQKVSMTEATGTLQERTTRYEYVSANIDLPTWVITSSVAAGFSRETSSTYDENLNITSVSLKGFDKEGNVLSRISSFERDDVGRVIGIDGPRTDVDDTMKMSYHDCDSGAECGQLASRSNALGHTTTFDTYDDRGLLTQSTDSLGVVTTWKYDLRNRIARVTRIAPGGETRTTAMSHDNEGQLLSVMMADGVTFTYSYDAAHNLGSITDNLGNTIDYAYDLKGNKVRQEISDPLGQHVRWAQAAFDLRDRVAQTNTAGSIVQTVYDAAGDLVSQTDPNLNPPTTHHYDGLGRLTQTLDALSNSTEFEYDTQNHLVGVSAPNGASTTYEYDDLGNLIRESSPDRGVTRYSYDAAGNVVSINDARDITATYAYDALDRLTAVDYPGASEDVTIGYDTCGNGTGRICRVLDQSGEISYEYDVWGNVVMEKRTIEGMSFVTRYAYDRADRIISMGHPSGRLVEYVRDRAGRITDVRTTVGGDITDVLTGRAWRADGALLNQTFGNGIVESRTHDLKGRMNQQSVGVLEERSHRYDPNGNLVSLIQNTSSREYGYDPLDRLIDDLEIGSGPLPDFQYGYDPNGNRETMVKDGAIREYVYMPGSNLLVRAGRHAVAHDLAGHQTGARSGRRSFAYNQAGRVDAYLKNGELKAAYVYDYLGRRVYKVKAGNRVVYHYDKNGHLIGESDGSSGKPIKDYVWAGDQPVLYAKVKRTNAGLLKEKQRIYLVSDHLNTPRLGLDENRTVIWRWDGEPFGLIRPDKDPDGDGKKVILNLRFPGQYYDSESGLHYNWNRYYDPKTGRYITSDPIGLFGGSNTYLYGSANPNTFIDPLGLLAQGIWIEPPRFNVNDIGVDGWDFISPSVSKWGYLHLLRLYGHARGYVNIDVECTDDCDDWQVHDQISINARGSFDAGPNLLALGVGYGAGPYFGIMTNIVILGAAALQAEHHYLSLAEQKAGPIIASALANGPTLLCLVGNRQ